MSDRDPAAIEQDLQATRARLGANLDELTRRLSPGQLLDEGLAYVRTSQGSAFVRNLGTQVRDNPLPVVLAGLSIGWLALAGNLPQRSETPRHHALVPYDAEAASLAERARHAGQAVARVTGETEDAFRGRVADAQAGAMGIARQIGETAGDFMSRVARTLADAQEAGQRRTQEMRDTAADWTEQARSGLNRAGEAAGNMMDRGRENASRAGDYASRLGRSGVEMGAALLDNPVLLAAVGIAAGAVFGALLPPSETERQYVGDAANRAADAVRDAAGDAMERGGRVAKAAMDAGWQAAQEQGIAPGAQRATHH
jgi:hypothetical protein